MDYDQHAFRILDSGWRSGSIEDMFESKAHTSTYVRPNAEV